MKMRWGTNFRRRARAFVLLWALACLLAWAMPAQTKLHLPTQSAAADFSQFALTRPARLSTVLPPSCLNGELLFKTDAPAGENLHICFNSSWHALNTNNSPGGATNLSELSDLRVSATATLVTVAAGRVRFLDSMGRYAVSELNQATVSVAAGAESGTLRLEVDDASGIPVLRCLFGSGLTPSNYTLSNCTATAQSFFSAGAMPLATVSLSNGVWGAVVDLRTMGGTANYLAGAGLSKVGNVFSVNPAVVPMLATANTWTAKQTMVPGASSAGLNVGGMAGDPSSLSNGDIWYDSTAGKFRCREGGVTVNCVRSAGGSNGQIQFHDSGSLAGDNGLTWNNTAKELVVSRSGSGPSVTVLAANVAAGGDVATVQSCLNNDTANCTAIRHSLTNFDGSGEAYWAGLIRRSGASTIPIVTHNGANQVHLGGDGGSGPLGSGPGWMAVTAGGVSRFAAAPTAGLGLAPILGVVSLSGQTGNLGALTLLNASHAAGTYRVCGTASVTSAGTGTFPVWTVSWRDTASGTNLVKNLAWDEDGVITLTPSLATATAISAICKTLHSTGASAISIDPGDGGSAVFDLFFTVERMQ